jgi:translation initiation factor 1
MKSKLSSGGLVYSTETGRMCPTCRQPVAQCSCRSNSKVLAGSLTQLSQWKPADGVLRVSRETKGRGGKAVTVVKGVVLDADALAALGKQLRTACGSGGTVKDGVLEIQGDHCDRVMLLLKEQGFSVKRAGG